MHPIDRRKAAAALLVVTLVAGWVRFVHLSKPHTLVFDETYYAKDACFYIGIGYRECGLKAGYEQSWVHPPLGKWMIAGGIAAFGYRPFGYRFASATFGTLSVTLTAFLALLLFESAWWALIAGVLLATESLNLVQSRLAMLDIFLTFWVVLGFVFLALDRRWILRRTPIPDADDPPEATVEPTLAEREIPEPPPPPPPPPRAPSPVWRPWRFATGIAFGAAAATKWSGILPALGAIALSMGWEWSRRRATAERRPLWRAIQQESFGVFVFLVLLPIAVYLASYARWFADNGLHPSSFWRLQADMANYHLHLTATHPYKSRPWTWILLKRPVAYYFVSPGREILGIGNPAIFWAGLLTIPYAAAVWIARRDWRGGFLVVATLGQYLPWFLAKRPQFLFYITPVTPFLVLAATLLLVDLSRWQPAGARSRALLPVAAGFVVASIVAFWFFWPVLTGYPLSQHGWQARMWYRSWI